MKERITLSAIAGSRNNDDWRAIAKRIVEPLSPLDVREERYSYRFVFGRYPPEMEEVVRQLREIGFRSDYTVKREYTKKEMLEAEYLFLGYSGQVNSKSGTFSDQLEMICPYCGFQEARWEYETLQIREEADGYRMAVVDHHAPVMSHALADALRDTNATGLLLAPVGGSEPADWYGWRCSHVLPPMVILPSTVYHEESYRTKQCKRDHAIIYKYIEKQYRRTDFDACDFNYSYELTGDRFVGGIRYEVISQRVFRLLLSLGKGNNWSCTPVSFVD